MNNHIAMIHCASCYERLWAFRLTSDGQPSLIPAQIEVPLFIRGTDRCPFCEQDIYLKTGNTHRFYVKDERSGRMGVG